MSAVEFCPDCNNMVIKFPFKEYINKSYIPRKINLKEDFILPAEIVTFNRMQRPTVFLSIKFRK